MTRKKEGRGMKLDSQHDQHKRSSKDMKYLIQYDAAYEGFKRPCTMKELSVRLGIDRANICWYVREMRKLGLIAVIKKVWCSITKHKANQYTTNPALMPKPQPTLFDL